VSPLLTVNAVSKHFGGLKALDSISFTVGRGEIYGIIGPNGAGKTTLFNCLTGLYVPDHGEIRLGEVRLSGCKPHAVLAAGFARTFQNIRLFAQMSVLENVLVGLHSRLRSGVLGAIFQPPATRREEAEANARARALLARVGIDRHPDTLARTLSYGEQRRLEIARALASDPQLLALDEPAAGMNGAEKNALRELLFSLRAEGLSLLLIEHDVKLVMQSCDRILVLDYGQRLCEGPPAQVRHDPRVIEAYLGAPAA
jgi:branched-chain amino acid transport system ATP-binding protein